MIYNSNTFIFLSIFGLCREASNNDAYGMRIQEVNVGVEAKLNTRGKVTLSSNGFDGIFIDSLPRTPNTNLDLEINVENGSSLILNQNGIAGFRAPKLNSSAKLNVDVKEGGSFESCGNIQDDIFGDVFANAAAKFSGTGYTCDQAKVVFTGPGGSTVVKPVCQDCPPSL